MSSGPSRYFFGHTKAARENSFWLDVQVTLTNIPYTLGYSQQRWRQGMNCMIKKELGNWRVDKICTILPYEADSNFLNKKLGRAALR